MKLLCPENDKNPQLIGNISEALLQNEKLELEEWKVEKANPDLVPGGYWKPKNCTPIHKVNFKIKIIFINFSINRSQL